jgi:hypothetical protein
LQVSQPGRSDPNDVDATSESPPVELARLLLGERRAAAAAADRAGIDVVDVADRKSEPSEARLLFEAFWWPLRCATRLWWDGTSPLRSSAMGIAAGRGIPPPDGTPLVSSARLPRRFRRDWSARARARSTAEVGVAATPASELEG